MNVNMSFFFTSKKKKEKRKKEKKLTDVLMIIVNKLFYENFDVIFMGKKKLSIFSLFHKKKSIKIFPKSMYLKYLLTISLFLMKLSIMWLIYKTIHVYII